MLKKVFFFTSALALVASCAEDSSWSSESVTGSPETVMLSEGDLTFGFNSIITETDSLSCLSVPLNTSVPVTISCSKDLNALKCVNIDGKYYLQVANPDQTRLGVDEVTLSIENHPELTKRFLLTVNDSKSLTRAANQDSLRMRFANVFSQGQYIWEGPSEHHPRFPMLRSEVLLNGLSDVESMGTLLWVDQNFQSFSEVKTANGSTLEEYTHSVAVNIGGQTPLAESWAALLSGSFSDKSSEHSKSYYEYMTKTKATHNAAAVLTKNLVSIPANDTLWKRLITEELDNVLNNPGSNQYKYYSEDLDGACKIIEAYGSHLLTYCTLGTMAKLNFRKKQDITESSTEWALQVALREYESLDANQHTQDAVAAANYINENAAKINFSIGISDKDYLENVEANLDVVFMGGNANTNCKFDDWIATDNPDNWLPVEFIDPNEKEATLIAIYKLCQDKESARYKTLYKALEMVNEKGINYYCAWKKPTYKPATEETEWVLGGVYVDVNAGAKAKARPQKRELANGFKTMFYPVTDVGFSVGNCLDTQTSNFGNCKRNNSHHWYYAVVMRDDFHGLEDLMLVNVHQENEWNNKGYSRCITAGGIDFGDGWVCHDNNSYLLMEKAIPEDDFTTMPLTGYRLEAYSSHWGKSGDYRLVGASGGTNRGNNGSNNNRYKYYWTSDAAKPYVKDVDNSKGKPTDEPEGAVYNLFWIPQPYYLYLSTTRVPLRPEDVAVAVPNDMEKNTSSN